MKLNIFSCACWPPVCLHWRSVCLGLLPIFQLDCFFVLSIIIESSWKEFPMFKYMTQKSHLFLTDTPICHHFCRFVLSTWKFAVLWRLLGKDFKVLGNPWLDAGSRHIAYWVHICILSTALFTASSLRIWNSSTGILSLPGASVRSSTHDKGHEEGGSTYAKAGSSLRSAPGNPRASTPITRACLLYYFVLSPTPLTLRGAVPHHLFRRRS